jgi:serine/threonine protein kinase
MALGHMHENNIVYRNLKNSNILINEDGYLKLGDFDTSKQMEKNYLSMSILNLTEYQAPEVVNNQHHDRNVDWWALGIVLSQMLFVDIDITSDGVNFPDDSKVSDDARDLITKLLANKKENRLGYDEDADEILKHKFFKNIDPSKILKKEVEPPYIPFIHPHDPYFVANFNSDLVKLPSRESVIDDDEKYRMHQEIEKMDLQPS